MKLFGVVKKGRTFTSQTTTIMKSFKLFISGDSKKCWSIHKKIFQFLEREMIFGEVFANDEIMTKEGMMLDIDYSPNADEIIFIANIKNVTIL